MRARSAPFERLGRTGDVAVVGARQRADGRFPDRVGDRLHGFEVAVGAGGEAGLDHVDLQALELAGDAQLLVLGHGGAGRLLAVAQGGVENDQFVCHVVSFLLVPAWAPLQARDDGLERGRDDVRIHADAEQRPLADAQFEVGHGLGVGARADRMLMVVEHADGFTGRRGQRLDEGVDRAVAGALDVDWRPPTSTSAASVTQLAARRPAPPPAPGAAAPGCCCTPYSRSNSSNRSCARQLLAGRVHHGLHDLAELDLQAARQLQAVLAFQQVGDAALARLAVDADHGLVAAAQVLGVERQVGHVPDVAFLARGERLLDRVLVRARERGVDQVARVRVAGMHRQLVAVLDGAADFVDVGEVQAGVHALRVEVQRDVHQVEVAGALAVAEEAAFEAVGAGHHGEFAGRGAGAAVVVRMDRQHDGSRAAPGCGASTRSCRRRCWASNAPPSKAG